MTVSFDIEMAGPTVNVELVPRGKKGDQGNQGTAGALTPGVFADRPVSSDPGRSYLATDTGDTYTWTGSVWMLTGQGYPSTVLGSAAPASIAALSLPTANTIYRCPELTTGDFVIPASGQVRVSASSIGFAGTPAAGLRPCIMFSKNAGSTWTSIAMLIPQVVIASFAYLSPDGSVLIDHPGITGHVSPGDTVRVAIGASSTSASQTATFAASVGASIIAQALVPVS